VKTKQVPLVDGAAVSDEDNPEWLTDIPGSLGSLGVDDSGVMQMGRENHGHPGVLTIHGLRDLMHYVTEEIHEAEEKGETHVKLPEFLRKALPQEPNPVYVISESCPARGLHTETIAVPVAGTGQSGGATLISSRSDRVRIVITNVGANPVFLSHSDDVNNVNVSGESAWCLLPAGSPAPSVATPAVNQIPLGASGVATFNNNSAGVQQTITGGTVTAIAINGTSTGQTSGVFFVPAGGTVTVTYTVAPTTFTTAGIPVTTPPVDQIPGNPREIRSGGKLYAYSPLGGVIDIQEEYGSRYGGGDFLNP
jgi:hypothetical protein